MNKKITITLIIFLIVLMLMNINVLAATGSFEVTVKSKTLTVGDTTTLSIVAKECAGVFTVTSSNSDVVSVGSVPDWIEEETKIVILTSKKAGSATITITASDVGDTDANPVTGSKTVDITVKAKEPTSDTTTNNNTGTSTNTNSGTTTTEPKEKSSNAYLSTLGVRIKEDLAKELGVKTNEYDFSGFSKKKTTYNVTIPSNVDYLKVEYKADAGATVKVTGNSDFEVGSNNKITIKVTAEDGKTTQTYTIKVTKLAEEEEKPGNVIEDEEGVYLTSLELEGIVLSPEFAKDTYSYTATLSKTDVTELKVTAKANKENANIEISGNTNLVAGENTINIVVKENESSVQTVYQVVVTKEEALVATNNEVNLEDSNLISNIMGNMKKYLIIAVAVVVLMILAVIILIILLRKENKRLKNKDTLEENNEYDVYQNDEKEFEKNNKEEVEVKSEENISNESETETKNEGKKSKRRERGKHSK